MNSHKKIGIIAEEV